MNLPTQLHASYHAIQMVTLNGGADRYKANYLGRGGTQPRLRKVNWTPDMSARPGRLQRRAFV
jgi:hypothetical protein